MKNPILLLCRWYVLRRDRSGEPTSLLPLRKVHSVTVLVDTEAAEEDSARISRAARQFFDYQGIPVRILSPARKDLDLIGRIKGQVRGSREEDLFISLAASPDNFTAEYEARCSKARFKVGRCSLPGRVFDLVVAAPESGETSQAAAFAAIKDYLNKIR